MSTNIDSTTSIPLFATLAAIPIMVGFIVWLSTIYSIASNAYETNSAQDVKIEATKDLLVDIRERVIRIEERVTNQTKGK